MNEYTKIYMRAPCKYIHVFNVLIFSNCCKNAFRPYKSIIVISNSRYLYTPTISALVQRPDRIHIYFFSSPRDLGGTVTKCLEGRFWLKNHQIPSLGSFFKWYPRGRGGGHYPFWPWRFSILPDFGLNSRKWENSMLSKNTLYRNDYNHSFVYVIEHG